MVTSIAFLLAFCAVSVRYIPSTLSPLHPSLRRSGVVYPPPVYHPPPAYPPPAYDVQGPRGGPVDGYGAAPVRWVLALLFVSISSSLSPLLYHPNCFTFMAI